MDTGTQSSSALDEALSKFALPVQEAVVEPTQTTVTEPNNDPVTTEPNDEPVTVENEPVTTNTPDNNEGNEEWGAFFEAADYKGDIKEIGSVQDLVTVVNDLKGRYEDKVAILERPDIKPMVDYLQKGGSIQAYQALPQPTYDYQDVQFEEDHVTEAEEFLTEYFKELNVPEDSIPSVIADLKGKGKLIESGNSALESKRLQEEQRNAQIEASNQAVLEKEVQEFNTFISGVTEAYSKPLNGVTASKELLAEAKVKSIPNSQGVVEVMDIVSGFTPKQHAILNLAILAVAGGKNFSYIPSGTPAAPKSNPIDRLQQKGGGSSNPAKEEELTPQEFEAYVRSLKGKN